MLFAGIDLGTSGCRIAVIDEEAKLKHSHSISYQATQSQTPELWWNSVQQLLSKLPDNVKRNLNSLAIDGTSGTLLLVDKNGNPSSQALMYDDLRATQEAAVIKQTLPLDNGGQGASGSLARLLWLLKHEANNEHCNALHQADYILGKLSNHYGLSDENNCLKLGYDVVNRCWPEDTLLALGVDLSLLPTVFPAGIAVDKIDKLLAKQLGLPTSLQLVTGTTDSIAAFIATGTNKIGEAVTSLGSTLVVKMVSDKPIFAPKFGIYSHRLAGSENRWLLGGASNSGGKVIRHYFPQTQINDMTLSLSPDQSTGLDYYPLIQKGERFPFSDPEKPPQLSPRPASDIVFFQGLLEGIANIEAQAYQRLIKLGAPPLKSLRSVGGGSKNLAWTNIRQQLLKVKMITPKQTEACYGSALLAQKGIMLNT